MKIKLVITHERARQDFPDAAVTYVPRPNARSGIIVASYEVTPDRCATALGRWLATHVCTTRLEDDGSLCRVILPFTEADLTVREYGLQLATRTALRNQQDADALFEEMLTWVENRRRLMSCYGPSVFRFHTFQFQWPVFGSASLQAETVEAYFDECAALIRRTDGVIWQAGLSRATLPESLARTMAIPAGGGNVLLQRFLAT